MERRCDKCEWWKLTGEFEEYSPSGRCTNPKLSSTKHHGWGTRAKELACGEFKGSKMATDLPELRLDLEHHSVVANDLPELTDEQANEIIRRCKAEPKLREAVGLLNCMILSGEKHSDISRKVVEQAFEEKD